MDFLAHSALGQNRLSLRGVFRKRRVDLPIEIVKQGGDAELPGIRRNAGFHRKCVLTQGFRFREFAEDLPSLLPIHSSYDNSDLCGEPWRRHPGVLNPQYCSL